MKILMAASEIVPFAKTGGLADVAGSLPPEIAKLGHDIAVVMPKYRQIDSEKYSLVCIFDDLQIYIGDTEIHCRIFQSIIPGTQVKAYFIDQPAYFDRPQLYQEKGLDYADNAERFIFFSRAVLELCKKLSWIPDVIHCNDWQTALIPVYLKTIYAFDSLLSNITTVYTIHNLAYQGIFPKENIIKAGLSWNEFTMDKLEFWDQMNFTKGGLVYADLINTVSTTYAKEIRTEEMGYGLQGILESNKDHLYGVINGLDYASWSPNKDPLIKTNYSMRTLDKKEENKKALLKIHGLPYKEGRPVLGLISRLTDQKGFDILAEIIEDVLDLNIQFVLLGTGEPRYHQFFTDLKVKFPKKVGVSLKYDAIEAQLIYAGCDMFLMPSKFEPCGLGQLIALKYGTIPIVRETGGLADTIIDFDLAKDFEKDKGNGFVFVEYKSADLFATIQRAIAYYHEPKVWRMIQRNAMRCDYSWTHSATVYEEYYKKISKV